MGANEIIFIAVRASLYPYAYSRQATSVARRLCLSSVHKVLTFGLVFAAQKSSLAHELHLQAGPTEPNFLIAPAWLYGYKSLIWYERLSPAAGLFLFSVRSYRGPHACDIYGIYCLATPVGHIEHQYVCLVLCSVGN